jgi:hypothetical protein
MDLHLEPEQVEQLRTLLDEAVRDLHYELAATDNSEYKAMLRGRLDSMQGLLDLVGGPLPSTI